MKTRPNERGAGPEGFSGSMWPECVQEGQGQGRSLPSEHGATLGGLLGLQSHAQECRLDSESKGAKTR